jgi:hypothetical protein
VLIRCGSYGTADDVRAQPDPVFPQPLSLNGFDTFLELCGTSSCRVLLAMLTILHLVRGSRLDYLRLLLIWAFTGGYVFIIGVTAPAT